MTSLFGGAGGINVSAAGTLVPETFIATEGQTVFVLTKFTYTTNSNSLLVFLNGQKQVFSKDFNETSTTSFTLLNPTVAGDVVEIIGFPLADITQNVYVVNTPGDGTVTPAKLSTGGPSWGEGGNFNYGNSLTGGTGVVNIGAGQIYKDANGNFGVGTNSPQAKAVISNGGAAGLEIFANYPGGGMGTYLQSYNRSSLGLVDTAYDALSHSFRLGSVEVIFIASNGNVQMGERSGSAQVNITASSAKNPLDLENFDDLGRGVALKNSSGVNVGAITWTATGANYATSSDYRLKKDIRPMTGALARNALLEPVCYRWKIDGSEGEGFIADKLQGPFPNAVTGKKDATRTEQYVAGTRTVTKQRQVTDLQIEEREEIVLIDGKRVLRMVEYEVSVPLFEDVPVFNEDGSVATITIAAVRGADGQVITPETTAARTVQVPVMQEYEEEENVMAEREVPDYQGIGTGPLDGHFSACINELQAIITTLTERIEALEGN